MMKSNYFVTYLDVRVTTAVACFLASLFVAAVRSDGIGQFGFYFPQVVLECQLGATSHIMSAKFMNVGSWSNVGFPQGQRRGQCSISENHRPCAVWPLC